jgi:rubrerythrin
MGLLNQALRLEYSLIVHYPRLANTIKDEETRKLVLELGSASIRHADVVANTITQLGGEPDWSMELYPDEMDTVEIFQTQLEKEKLALKLHRESADLVPSNSLQVKLSTLAREEEQHIQIVNRILSRL